MPLSKAVIADKIAQLTWERITGVLRSRSERAVQESLCSGCMEKPCPKFEAVVNRLLAHFWRIYVEGN